MRNRLKRQEISTILLLLTVGFLLMFLLAGCTRGEVQESPNTAEAQKLTIVCCSFYEYDFVKNIIGEQSQNIEIRYMMKNGADMHSYQPTSADIVEITNCDMVVYTGGISQSWISDILGERQDDFAEVNLMRELSDLLKNEEIVEGMEGYDAHNGDEEELDEHIWLSLKNAAKICEILLAKISEISPSEAEIYTQNASMYIDKLNALDQKYEEMIQSANKDTVLFADRFPFRYLLDDYGIKYYAAFPGCFAETEASFQTVIFLAEKVWELDLSAILIIEDSSETIANTVLENTEKDSVSVYALDSMQAISEAEIQKGATYLQVMEDNFEKLKTALE